MGDVIPIKPTNLAENLGFIQDCCRFQEGILTQANMKLKYRSFTDDVWEKLGDDIALLEAVEDEKIRRIRSGAQKRERSQHLITKAPAILDSIACDVSASPRHRVDAIKTLDSFTGNPQEGAPLADRFVISIHLGADVDGKPIVEHYNKSISINADDGDPNDGERPAPSMPVTIPDKAWDGEDVRERPAAKTPAKYDEIVIGG